MSGVPVARKPIKLLPDARRVITKLFVPGEPAPAAGRSRVEVVLQRIMAMPEADVVATLEATMAGFAQRHRDIGAVIEDHFALVSDRFDVPDDISHERRRLIGFYFTHEYSVEAAALGNPSMVVAPDQSGLRPGQTRFILSLRAVGEGHISSIEFRTGVVGPDGDIVIDGLSGFAVTARRTPHRYDKDFFHTKLGDLGALNDLAALVLGRLQDNFTIGELEASIEVLDHDGIDRATSFETARILHWLASSNYASTFPESSSISERVIFPGGPTESHGMEDARFVRFVDDDDTVCYYATYTAYDGFQILPQLIETVDFRSFRVATLSGDCAQNKGIALFPRKLQGRFAALGRHDNVNNFIMMSDDVRVWRDTKRIQEPEQPWELVQLGNCGSPLETDAGWLVITHGVGPMRQYSLGALLLDLDDPCRVIGHLKEPLLAPNADEREGYVPNVVYSCGAMIHGDHVVLPYGFADVGMSIATIPLDDLFSRLV